jgi:hypothetical protein
MSNRDLRKRLPLRLILVIVALALAWSPLGATVMPGDGGSGSGHGPGYATVDVIDDGGGMHCHGGGAPDPAADPQPCPHCDSPLHALCTCCPTAASVAIPVIDNGPAAVSHARAPASMGRVAALPHGPDERHFRPPITLR